MLQEFLFRVFRIDFARYSCFSLVKKNSIFAAFILDRNLAENISIYSRQAYNNFNDNPTYDADNLTLTTKLGCKITPFERFYIDVWYERTDQKAGDTWSLDAGLISVCCGINL